MSNLKINICLSTIWRDLKSTKKIKKKIMVFEYLMEILIINNQFKKKDEILKCNFHLKSTTNMIPHTCKLSNINIYIDILITKPIAFMFLK